MAFPNQPVEKEKVQGPSKSSMRLAYKPKGKKMPPEPPKGMAGKPC